MLQEGDVQVSKQQVAILEKEITVLRKRAELEIKASAFAFSC